MTLAKVGIIFLEDYNGGLVGKADYDIPTIIRERTIVVAKVRYEQNRQTSDRHWVYRAIEPAHEGTTAELRNIEFTTEPSEPVIGWDDIDGWLKTYCTGAEPVPISRIRDLQSLLQKLRDSL